MSLLTNLQEIVLLPLQPLSLGFIFLVITPESKHTTIEKVSPELHKGDDDCLPHLSMHIILPALDIAAFSPKAGLCSPTNLLKSFLILSHKTGVSWVVFVRVFISTHAQSFAFGLSKCTLLLQVFLLFIKTILKSSPIQQSASDSPSLVSPATSIISVSTSLSKSLLKTCKET